MSKDVIIVGLGVSGTAVFIQLVKKAIKNQLPSLSITLIEKETEAGPGYPYKTSANNTLKVNDPNSRMILMADQRDDFVCWLNDKKPEYSHGRFAPRRIFGEYVREKFNEYIEIARQNNINVTIINQEEIIAAKKIKDIWQLQSKSGNSYLAKNLVLALGHLPSDRYLSLIDYPNFYSSPWENNLSDILPEQSVAILGSSLTAIDTAKLLNAQNHKGAIYFISPSGQLPRVKGPATTETYTFKYLNKDCLETGNLTLSDLLGLFTREINDATNGSFNTEEILSIANNPLDGNVENILRNEVASVESGMVKRWKLLLNEIFYDVLPIINKQFSSADQQAFRELYFPIYAKWSAGIILENAKEILSLFNTGQLKILKGIKTICYSQEYNKFQIATTDAEMHVDTVINASGTGHNIKQHPLLINMLEKGYIESHPLGGFKVSEDFNLISAGKPVNNGWGLGPTTFGDNIAAYAAEISAINALTISEGIIKNL